MKIAASARTEQGTGASRRLRNTGTTPGIVYGANKEPVKLKLDHNTLFYALQRPAFHSSILDLEIDGQVEQVILRDYQMHAYKPLVMHVDFQRIDPNQKITIRVPLKFVNAENSPAIKMGGSNISHTQNTVEVSCLPKDLPEFLTADLSGLNAGQSAHVADLAAPDGVEIIDNPKATIAYATKAK